MLTFWRRKGIFSLEQFAQQNITCHATKLNATNSFSKLKQSLEKFPQQDIPPHATKMDATNSFSKDINLCKAKLSWP
ncbi:hypothetical protein SUGI_0563620 [Cryptomeria japonica]|nr:hypothetical protein SUGI_0563620 [Cryptomeria japonica]